MPAECPICRYQFGTGILGWDKHIGTFDRHPDWRPDLRDPAARQAAFIAEFPEFFANAKTPSRRHPPGAARANPPPVDTDPVPPPTDTAPLVEHGKLRCPTCGAPLTYSTRP